MRKIFKYTIGLIIIIPATGTLLLMMFFEWVITGKIGISEDAIADIKKMWTA